MYTRKIVFFLWVVSMALSACSAPVGPSQTPTPGSPAGPTETAGVSPSPASTAVPSSTVTLLPTETLLPTNTPTPVETSTPTQPPAPSVTPSSTATTAPVKLRGKVTIDQAVCHYGPGAPYLYKYGVYKGNTLELLRRIEGGSYVEVQAVGGDNRCWVRVDYFDIQGNWLDLPAVRFDDVRPPITPYYPSPGGVSARRDGSQVTVFWNPLILDPGNSSEQVPYVIEAWVCQDGENVFAPTGSYETAVRIVDEPGCAEPSYGYFIAAEKHGYTPRVKVPWPTAAP